MKKLSTKRILGIAIGLIILAVIIIVKISNTSCITVDVMKKYSGIWRVEKVKVEGFGELSQYEFLQLAKTLNISTDDFITDVAFYADQFASCSSGTMNAKITLKNGETYSTKKIEETSEGIQVENVKFLLEDEFLVATQGDGLYKIYFDLHLRLPINPNNE